jgi:spore germination cell wall hydrolase CwlJ-like protein
MTKEEFDKLNSLTDDIVLTLCLWGEARGEEKNSKIAIASVIKQRVKVGGWFGNGWKGVILKNKQFSCFNSNDINLKKILGVAENFSKILAKNKVLRECHAVAWGIITGVIDPSIEATHYLSIYCNAFWEGKLEKVATIGNHDFYI